MRSHLVFSVHAELDFVEKPLWLDEFRRVFDKPRPYHLTLKTNTYLESDQVVELASVLERIAREHRPMTVTFDRIEQSKAPRGWCLMIMAVPNPALNELQRDVSQRCAFGPHTHPVFESFEREFAPRLTIARHLDDGGLERARSRLGDGSCVVRVRAIASTITARADERLSDASNTTVFTLKN
ncbi:MAG: 2'-5' RNA ligase family protein [Candidatus Woesearchaeota archaeon]